MNFLECLNSRRSVKATLLHDPGPSEVELTQILTIATRVPDHGKLTPWRLKILDKLAQKRLGKIVAGRFSSLNPDATPQQSAYEAQKIQRAPLLLVVMFTPQEGRIPLWEQQLSCGAVCMNVLHACHALGYGANWLTEWVAFDAEIARALGGGSEDRIAGLIYIGSYDDKPEERPRPALTDVASRWPD